MKLKFILAVVAITLCMVGMSDEISFFGFGSKDYCGYFRFKTKAECEPPFKTPTYTGCQERTG